MGTDISLDGTIEPEEQAALTYLSRALNSNSLDEFVSRVTDSTGTQIDPMGN